MLEYFVILQDQKKKWSLLVKVSYNYHMKNPLYQFKQQIEWRAFGVCTAVGEKLGIASTKIRLWFIYISFLTLGSPVILYMILAFWMNIKNYIFLSRRNPLKV